MIIDGIITKHYDKLHSLVKGSDISLYNGNTTEDIFQNAILTAMNKFKDKDIDEKTGIEYLNKLIKSELFFCYRRKKKDILTLTDNINAYDRMEDE